MLKKEDIMHIAQLARIGLKEEEIEKYQRELSLVLDYFKKLEAVDTENIESIGHITGSHSVVRDDKIIECEAKIIEEIINNFPDQKNNQVKVKSILT
ncbi:MAG: Aspartyl/glutamyl-tRNA(Asn/Gln) amidotransferase subunit C [Candidatus Moranbacteria bacterium GW2011_GWE1_35_17]|nr:MAG: Aspartyl/glutamyl-tRNA(Asn/Gln) amidotransferase subunit C [Candidatus Moranbacteria bacterium GW2011_GWE1_35_17]KKP67299.1 MAG: Aspartyl/glutamyl-tRNA(Asn/Gln) amidotransferase subunit C [Candidatus Moranbacteria bacterium GW2011_GWE2_35_164]KKP80909.1 MAG: Aspartyl/glutamyl-tRNA(Asn/Gln) amidotransferase subunit C [Candidatus Moranbacteria bacterium GW2011_GWF1_35_5]KKP83525.1 MAG: Aspartyl/glutamyl-tRNA(Asn/Gln) amidotransferase subunit C [Candidatus Moranbacteria bacterium GW2011_GWF